MKKDYGTGFTVPARRGPTRRAVVRRLTGIVCATALTAAVGLFTAPASAEGQLNIYNWGEYINPEVLKKFETETGIKVKLDTYSSNK